MCSTPGRASRRFGDPPVPRTRWAESTVIETERLRLRPFVDADVPRVVETCTDATTRHWLNGLPHPYVEATARGYLADCVWQAATGAKATWAVADRETDVLLGNVAVMDMLGVNSTGGEVGYWTHPDERGRGVMTEAVRAVVEHAFDPAGLDRARLVLHAAAGNPASNAVAVAAGFRHFGTQTAAELLGDGSFDDLHGYELLRYPVYPFSAGVRRSHHSPIATCIVNASQKATPNMVWSGAAGVVPPDMPCSMPSKMPTQIRMVPMPTATAKARIIHRRCCGTLSLRMARKASSRQARNQVPKTTVASRLRACRPMRTGCRTAARRPR